MRLERFNSEGLEPIGEGEEKIVFLDSKNKERVIAEAKESDFLERETPRQLKGRYYLTQIVHLLLPENIPAVYQASESLDGLQSVDAQHIPHTESHKQLVGARHLYKERIAIEEEVAKEIGKEIHDINSKLADLGFYLEIDDDLVNYIKDEKGNVQYIETFKPWEFKDKGYSGVLFDEKLLRKAIGEATDEQVRKKCNSHLERLLTLFKEEEQELKK